MTTLILSLAPGTELRDTRFGDLHARLPCSVRRCRLLFHRAYSPAATLSSHLHPPFFLPSSFLPPAAAIQPAQHTSPKERAQIPLFNTSFHPVSLGIHLVSSRRLFHLPSPAFFLPSYQQHLWSSSHRHTLPPTTSPPANLPLTRMLPPPLCTTTEMGSR